MNDQTDGPVDFSALDPTRHPARFDSLVDGVMRGAADELAARRAANNVIGQLARWRMPVLAAAAAAAVFLLVSSNGVATRIAANEPTSGIAEAIGISTEFAAWMRGESEPSAADIYAEFSSQ